MGPPGSGGHAAKLKLLNSCSGHTLLLLPEGSSSFSTEHRPQLSNALLSPVTPSTGSSLHLLCVPAPVPLPHCRRGHCRQEGQPASLQTPTSLSRAHRHVAHKTSQLPQSRHHSRAAWDLLLAWPCSDAPSATCGAGTTLLGRNGGISPHTPGQPESHDLLRDMAWRRSPHDTGRVLP